MKKKKAWQCRFFISAAALLLAACNSLSQQGDRSDHFDGERFFNPGLIKESSVAGYLRLRLTESQPEWPTTVPVGEATTVGQQTEPSGLTVTMIGHATLLITIGDMVIVTDPVWSERASPVSFAGPRRVVEPALALAELPAVDLILISHNHYDHLDLPTLRALDSLHSPRVIVPKGNRELVAHAMPTSLVTEHDWGEQVLMDSGASVSVEPIVHGSGRSPFDQQQTLWAGYVVQNQNHTVYFVGDAGFGDGQNFVETASRYDDIDLIALPIGAYAPTWFMADSHMSPEQALQAFELSGARYGVGHHFDTFQLGFEAFGEPHSRIDQMVVGNDALIDRFYALKAGESFFVPPIINAAK